MLPTLTLLCHLSCFVYNLCYYRRDADLAQSATYSNVARTMRRYKEEVKTTLPADIKTTKKDTLSTASKKLGETEGAPYTLHGVDHKMTIECIEGDEPNSYQLLIYDPEFVKEFEEEEGISIDGTFDPAPDINQCEQLLTVMVEKNGKVKFRNF